MRRYLPYLFVLGLLMVSCVRDVEIDLEDLPDRIVLNASVCPGKEVCAHLSKTWFIMDSVPDFELSDAKVRVYVNDEFQGLMRNDDLPEDSIHSRGQYVLPGCFVRQRDCLRIEAEADGYEPVSGETRIPGRARIYEVDTLSYRSSAYYAEYLRFSVKIGVETDSYYRLIVEQILDFRKGDSTRTVTSFRSLGGYSWYYSVLAWIMRILFSSLLEVVLSRARWMGVTVWVYLEGRIWLIRMLLRFLFFLLNTRMRVIPFLWTFITMCACCLSPRIIIDI